MKAVTITAFLILNENALLRQPIKHSTVASSFAPRKSKNDQEHISFLVSSSSIAKTVLCKKKCNFFQKTN